MKKSARFPSRHALIIAALGTSTGMILASAAMAQTAMNPPGVMRFTQPPPGYQPPYQQSYPSYPSYRSVPPMYSQIPTQGGINQTQPPRQAPELTTDITDQGYRLTLRPGEGQNPEDFLIQARGRMLEIISQTQRQQRSEQEFDNQSGFRRSISVSSSHFRRHVPVPGDANLDAMTRTNEDDAVVIILPRHQNAEHRREQP